MLPLQPMRQSTMYIWNVFYRVDNEGYFHNHLTRVPVINTYEDDPAIMASTMCNEIGVCTIRFNLKYITSQRVAELIMLHEMCHVKTWNQENLMFGGKMTQVFHGRMWRSCMLSLDAEGAFREIIIDNYSEGM